MLRLLVIFTFAVLCLGVVPDLPDDSAPPANACTADTCVQGVDSPSPVLEVALPVLDPLPFCNGNDSLPALHAAAMSCDDGNPCTNGDAHAALSPPACNAPPGLLLPALETGRALRHARLDLPDTCKDCNDGDVRATTATPAPPGLAAVAYGAADSTADTWLTIEVVASVPALLPVPPPPPPPVWQAQLVQPWRPGHAHSRRLQDVASPVVWRTRYGTTVLHC